MNRMAPTKRPAARSRFCETGGSETSGGEGEEGQGRAGWGRSEPGSHGGARASRRGTGRGASGAHHGALSVGSGEFPLHEILDALDAHGRALGGLRGPDPRSVRWSSSLVVGRTRSDARQRQQFSTRASALPFALESLHPPARGRHCDRREARDATADRIVPTRARSSPPARSRRSAASVALRSVARSKTDRGGVVREPTLNTERCRSSNTTTASCLRRRAAPRRARTGVHTCVRARPLRARALPPPAVPLEKGGLASLLSRSDVFRVPPDLTRLAI